jgi:MFS family permease
MNEGGTNLSSYESLYTRIKETPDFSPMIKILFWNSQGFFYFSFIIPLISSMYLNVTGLELGWIYSIRVIGGLISLPITGYLSDRFPRFKGRLVLFGAIGRGTAYIILFAAVQARSLFFVQFAMFIQGFGVGVFWPPFDSLIAEKSSKYHRSFAFGRRGAMIGWGNLVGTIGSFAIYAFSLNYLHGNPWILFSPLLWAAYTNYYGGWIFYRQVDINLSFEKYADQSFKDISSTNPIFLKEEKMIGTITPNLPITTQYIPNEHADYLGTDTYLRTKQAWFIFSLSIFFTGLVLTNLNEIIAKPFVQLYLIDNIESNLTLVMLIFFPSEIIAMLLAPKLGFYADKINEFVGITITCICGALVTLLLINTSSAWIFALLLIGDATFARLSGLIIQNILSRTSPAHRGLLFGLKTWMGHLGEVAGPLLGGYLWDVFGQQAPFRASISIELALIPVFIIAFSMLKPLLVEKKYQKNK